MHDLVFVLDNRKIFIHCFQSQSSDLLLPPELFIGKGFNEIPFPPATLSALDNAFNMVNATGKTQSLDYSLPFEGGTKWFNCNISSVPPSHNDPGGFIIIARDITDKMHTLLSLQAHEKRLSLLTNNINDLVTLYYPDGRLEYISPSVKSLLGYDPESLIGLDPSALIHPDDDAAIRQHFVPELFPCGKSFTAEYRIWHKNGYWAYFETNRKVIRDDSGRVINVVATCRDISAKKNVEIALRESEERYRSLAESSASIITLADRDGNFLYRNKIALEFEDWHAKQHPATKEQTNTFLTTTIRQVIDSNKGVEEERAIMRNGKRLWFRISVQPVINSAGVPYAALVNAIDITENKQHRELLEQQNTELKEIAFLQSHIIRSPLTNIQSLLSLIDEGDLSEDNKVYFALLKEASQHLDDTVREIVMKASQNRAGR